LLRASHASPQSIALCVRVSSIRALRVSEYAWASATEDGEMLGTSGGPAAVLNVRPGISIEPDTAAGRPARRRAFAGSPADIVGVHGVESRKLSADAQQPE
jgi:hypothetical protein